jgi:hypothetical protein
MALLAALSWCKKQLLGKWRCALLLVLSIVNLCAAVCCYQPTVFWGGLSHLAFLPLLPYLHQGLKE